MDSYFCRTDKWEGEDEEDDIKDAWDAESEEEKSESKEERTYPILWLYGYQ
jgi:hypothetical protein